MISVLAIPAEQRTRLYEGFLVLLGAATVAGIVLKPELALFISVACAALWFFGLVGEALSGRCEGIILLWATAFPLGYYYLSFPREASVVTLDRVVVLTALAGLFSRSSRLLAIPKTLLQAEIAWLGFIAIAAITLGKSPNVLNSGRLLLDGFLLPLLLAHCVIVGFDVRRCLPAMHTAICIALSICAAVAVGEVITGQDLLPSGNSAMFYTGGIARANGPFASNDQLALVGALSFFFLFFLRAALGANLTVGRRMLHSIGLAAALVAALAPMFRSIAITLVLALILAIFWERKASRRLWGIALVLAIVGAIFLVSVWVPDVFYDRSRPDNWYGRIAQHEQSLRVFADHPLLGVGFRNFSNFVVGDFRYVTSYKGTASLDEPHNNLTQVLAETGILGFIPYVAAQVLLLRAIWQLRDLSRSGRLVWKYQVFLFLSYWITGLTESSGYSPLNLVYLFMIAVICKYALTAPELNSAIEIGASQGRFSTLARNF